jgi:trans-aconitate methyltransferase
MTFDADAAAYDSFMGKYAVLLAPQLADPAGVSGGEQALVIGCGPGGLPGELVGRLGASSVSAVDPSTPFVASVRDRYREVESAPSEVTR